MQRTIYVFGLIAGLIISFFVFFNFWLMDIGIISMDNSLLAGYTAMVIALTMIFFGIKSYRDKQGGTIKFWKAVQVGLLISAIASVMYGGAALLHGVIFPGLAEKHCTEWANDQVRKLKDSGASPEVIKAKEEENQFMFELIKNPFLFFVIAVVVEIFPVGVIITFISAAILRKKEVLPYVPPATA